MSFPFLDETSKLNDAVRSRAAGSFQKLSDGVTHYELRGDAGRPTVVLVHGFSVPYFIFDGTFEFLAESGFRVLRYDLFGRGFSDRPQLRYDVDLFVRQLRELVDALQLSDLSLAGLSMGGPVTAAFINAYPQRAKRHILIDPCGARPIVFSRLLSVTKLPVVGELALAAFGSRSMVKSLAAELFDPALVEVFVERYKTQMQYHGFKRAILSSLRSGMLGEFAATYIQLGKLRRPTLMFWGRNDGTVPFEDSTLLRQWLPHAEFQAVENCGHLPHFEKPEEVRPILMDFLRRE